MKEFVEKARRKRSDWMKELIDALHVIQNECKRHSRNGNGDCENCPMYDGAECSVVCLTPESWKINDNAQRALL